MADEKIVIPNNLDTEEQTAPPADYLSTDQLADVQQELQLEEQFGDQPLKAAGLGAASAASFGLSDQLLTKAGFFTPEELREIDDRNKAAAIAGEVAGTAASLLTPGGLIGKTVGAAGKGVRGVVKAGEITEQITAKSLNKLIANTGERKFAKEVIKKAIPKAAGSAVEGAAFGAGQLVKEDALGTADFNAENLVTAMGGGALIGGTLGAGIGAVAPLFQPAYKIGKKGVDAAKKRVAQLTDAEDAALDLIGATTTQKINLKKYNSELVKELPDFLVSRGKLGKFSSTDDLFNNLMAEKDLAGQKIGAALKAIDLAADRNPALRPSKAQVFDGILLKLDEDYISKFGGKKAFAAQLRKVRQIRDDLMNVRYGDQPITAQFLQELRKQADDLAKFEKTPGKITMGEEAARDVRRALRAEIDNLAERISSADATMQGIAAELKAANKTYSITSQIEKPLVKKVNKPDRIASLTDLVAGGAAADFGVEAAAGTIGVKKFLESDFRRRLAVLSHVEKQNQQVTSKVASSIKDFFQKASKPAEFSTKAALIKSPIAEKLKEDKVEKPKNEQQAFQQIRENIIELSTDAEKMQDRLIRSTAGLARVAPETAAAAQGILARGIQFLLSKLPKEVYDNQGLPSLQRKRQVSELELSKFARYLEAVENPLSLLRDLQSGTATREQVEAVAAVYPDLYERIREETYQYLAEEQDLPYNKKVQIGVLLNIDADSSLRRDALADLQSRFRAEEAKQAAATEEFRKKSHTFSPGKASALDMAQRENSEAQAVASRNKL